MTDRVLVIDDEESIRLALTQVLDFPQGTREVRTAASGAEGLRMYEEFRPHVVLLDVKMEGMNGLETLERLRDFDPGAVVIMISGHADLSTAVEATKRGAFDFLQKPLDTERLLLSVRNALTHEEVATDNKRLRRESAERYVMVGKGAGMEMVREMIGRTAPTTARVLITGESGTGKELVARAIHENSPRRTRPFIEVNCAAIPAELIESELFGHVKGSFTGAVNDREGKFEQADSGTLFLDEVGDMALPAQAKVLRALQEGVINRVGGSRPIHIDVRVIAATNKDLAEQIAAGLFRKDLFYRLNVVPIYVPPLRERRDDIPALVEHFIRQVTGGDAGRKVERDALNALLKLPWPGNVRELRNSVERLLILAPGRTITRKDVAKLLGDVQVSLQIPAGASIEDFLDNAERIFLISRLREFDWSLTDCAKAIGITRSGLYKRMQRLDIRKRS